MDRKTSVTSRRFVILMFLAGTSLVHAQSLTLNQARYELRPGEPVALSAPAETVDFLRRATALAVLQHGFTIGPSIKGDEILLGASLLTAPGEYTLDLSAVSEGGERRTASIRIVVKPLASVQSATTKPPVVLLNGWQPGFDTTCPLSRSSDTFGTLGDLLLSAGAVPAVYFFDNCVECPKCAIEDVGRALGRFLNRLRDTTGAPIPQADLVAHSMGGLIVRAYLAGMNSPGLTPAFQPAASPPVRKFVEIATPNFGSFQARTFLGTQTAEMVPGSSFLWNLATWNQFGDDLRGVDALALAGNLGSTGVAGGPPNATDGVVSLSSASLGFARDDSRTRILPYCHTDSSVAIPAAIDCAGPGIAKVTDATHPTAQIVLSFLADSSAWTSIGKPPSQDVYLSQSGGMHFGQQIASGAWVTDLTSVLFGSTPLNPGPGPVAGQFFFIDLAKGSASFTAASTSLGTLTCGPRTAPTGSYAAIRCKASPAIESVTPLVSAAAGRVVASGGQITINGRGFGTLSGFGSVCSNCKVLASGTALQIVSWSDQAITVNLPSTVAGLVPLAVQTATGADSINIMTSLAAGVPQINPGGIVNGASYTADGSPGSISSVFGTSLASQTAAAAGLPLATSLGGVQLLVNGTPAPLFYVSARQINFQVPPGISGTAGVQVVSGTAMSPSAAMNVVAAAPGIFTVDSSGQGQGAVLNSDFSLNSASNPAAAGSTIMIYSTGLGAVSPALAAGFPGASSEPLNRTLTTPVVTVNGQPSTVSFSGVAPGFVGLYQVNAALPPGVVGNALTLKISAGGRESNTVTISIR